MINLLKIDLKRVFKDKLFLIVCIIAVAFGMITPLLYKFLFGLLEVEEAMMMVLDAKSLFFRSFAPGDNLGLIAPILIGIVLCKDFNQGTVRNKLICGKSRTSVFLSMFITCAIVLNIVMMLNALITLGFSLLFFDYQADPFTMKDFGYLLLSVGLEILVYVFIGALIAWLCVSMKNVGLVIVLYVAISFVFVIIGSVTSVALQMSAETGTATYKVLEFLSNINIFTSTVIGSGSYGAKELAYVLVPGLGGAALFAGLGIAVFKKKDLK